MRLPDTPYQPAISTPARICLPSGVRDKPACPHLRGNWGQPTVLRPGSQCAALRGGKCPGFGANLARPLRRSRNCERWDKNCTHPPPPYPHPFPSSHTQSSKIDIHRHAGQTKDRALHTSCTMVPDLPIPSPANPGAQISSPDCTSYQRAGETSGEPATEGSVTPHLLQGPRPVAKGLGAQATSLTCFANLVPAIRVASEQCGGHPPLKRS